MTDLDTIEEKIEKLGIQKTTPFCYACYKPAPSGCCVSCGSDDLVRELAGHGVEYGSEWAGWAIVRANLDPVDFDERFDELLNELYSEDVDICGLKMDPAYILKNMDPIAYRCMKSDYESEEIGETIIEDDKGNLFDLNELEDFLDAEIEEDEEEDEDED